MARYCWHLLVLGCIQCGDPTIVVPRVLGIVTVLPTQGATDVSVRAEGLVVFSDAVADPDGSSRDIELICEGAPPCEAPDASACAAVEATITFEDNNQVARITANPELEADRCYAIQVNEGILAANSDIGALPVTIRTQFRTR